MAKEASFKEIMESEAYSLQKSIIQREINSMKFSIDFSVFKKTPEEKIKLAAMKANWKFQNRK